MDSATSHELEIMVISGEDLYVSRRLGQPVKRNAFVVVKTDDGDDPSNIQRTIINKDGGSYPFWNDKFGMNFPMHARHITIEVQCKTALGNNIIGTTKIPKSEVLGGFVPLGYLHFLSYRLRDRYGNRNGIINVSVRVKTPEKLRFASGFSKPGSSLMHEGFKVSTSCVMGVPISRNI